jgi:hypothetical protein
MGSFHPYHVLLRALHYENPGSCSKQRELLASKDPALWRPDITAIGALDDIVLKLRRHGAHVEVIGLNEASATMVERFGTHHKPNARQKLAH